MSHYCLFAYGSLQIREVMRIVSGGEFFGVSARLEGYSRYCLKSLPYPGLCREAGAITEGVLYLGIDDKALERLDAFEDAFYQRVQVCVTQVTGERILAETYVIPPEGYGLLVKQAWSLERFRRESLRFLLADL